MQQTLPISPAQAAKLTELTAAFQSAQQNLAGYVSAIADGASIPAATYVGVGKEKQQYVLVLEVPDPETPATAATPPVSVAPERVRRGQRGTHHQRGKRR